MRYVTKFLVCFCILAFPLDIKADTLIKYDEKNSLVIFTDLLDARIGENHCCYIDLSRGFADKKQVSIHADKNVEYKVIHSTYDQNRQALQERSDKMWSGLVELKSGDVFSATAMRISYSLSGDNAPNKRYTLLKKKSICLTDDENALREIDFNDIQMMHFFHSGKTIKVETFKNQSVRGTVFCRKDRSKKENFLLTGVYTDSLIFFEIPIKSLKSIDFGIQHPSVLANVQKR